MLLPACASFREGPVPTQTHFGRTSDNTNSIALLIAGAGSLSEGLDTPGAVFEKWRAETERAYVDSGLFSEVTVGLAQAARRAEIRISARTRREQPWYFLCQFSLCTIPALFTTDLSVETAVFGPAGERLGSVESSERVHLYVQPLLIAVAAFRGQEKVTGEVIYDLNRSTIAKAQSRGWF
jgi:hypothetical protein